MITMNRTLLVAFVFLAASFSLMAGLPVAGQSSTTRRLSPNALISDLYQQHDRNRGPFFQTKSRTLLDKYFEQGLADMIWQDRVSAKEEVGVIDGDPLYDAQDMEIKKFAIGKAVYAAGKARIDVSFENFGKPKKLVFILANGKSGWKIDDIDYGETGTLRGWLKEGLKKQ